MFVIIFSYPMMTILHSFWPPEVRQLRRRWGRIRCCRHSEPSMEIRVNDNHDIRKNTNAAPVFDAPIAPKDRKRTRTPIVTLLQNA
jgi:hypothetical protein